MNGSENNLPGPRPTFTTGDLHLCTQDDVWVRDEIRWVVDLDNGETVYANENHPDAPAGLDDPWKRLKRYVTGNGLRVRRMRVQFRTNVVWLPEDAEGYYFSKGAVRVWGDDDTHSMLVVGVYSDGKVAISRWKTPEMALIDEETRDVPPDHPSLILNT